MDARYSIDSAELNVLVSKLLAPITGLAEVQAAKVVIHKNGRTSHAYKPMFAAVDPGRELI